MSENAPAAVVNVQPVQNYVTRELFDATITPIANDVSEMKGDVKLLLIRDAESRGGRRTSSRAKDHAVTLVAGGTGALLTLLAAVFIH